MTRILVTGASGCVGQYISRWLLDHSDAELLLWLRDPAKLTAVPTDHPRIRLLVGDLRDTDRFTKELASVNRVIHTATTLLARGCCSRSLRQRALVWMYSVP